MKTKSKSAHIVIDLGFGDSGKGSIVDALARRHPVHTVIRFNGGAQAAHNVHTNDGRHHTFSQFGSAMFVRGLQTYLSEYMVVSPWNMIPEAKALGQQRVNDAFARTFICEDALVITPFHRALNRLREFSRGDARHGSCGIGVGETVSDSLVLDDDLVVRVADFRDRFGLLTKLRRVQEFLAAREDDLITSLQDHRDVVREIWDLHSSEAVRVWMGILTQFFFQAQIVERSHLQTILDRDGDAIFEGAQGVLLDEWRGFHPYTTWSTCTDENARNLLHGYDGNVHTYGLLRAYATRHGPGPFPTFDPELTKRIPDSTNKTDPWQREFRIGWLDAILARYAMACCEQIDSLVITCLDRLRDEPDWKVCTAYQDGDVVDNNIPLCSFQDLENQKKLTEELFRVKPLFTSTPKTSRPTSRAPFFEDRVDAFIAFVSSALDCPVSVLSLGPTAKDKRFL